MIDQEILKELFNEALRSRKCAFAFRSHHPIGAAILTADNQIFGGCNIESVISGLGSCAERVAIDNAVSHGKYQFSALLNVDEKQTPICGVCLQYLLQFYQIDYHEIVLFVADIEGNISNKSISKLLPEGYISKNCNTNLEVYKQIERQ